MEKTPDEPAVPLSLQTACNTCVTDCSELKGTAESEQDFCLRGLRAAFRAGDISAEDVGLLIGTFTDAEATQGSERFEEIRFAAIHLMIKPLSQIQ